MAASELQTSLRAIGELPLSAAPVAAAASTDGNTLAVIDHDQRAVQFVACHQVEPPRIDALGGFELDVDTDGAPRTVAIVEPPAVPGAESQRVALVGTATGALLVVQLDGAVVSVADVGCGSPVVSIQQASTAGATVANPNVYTSPATADAILVTCQSGTVLCVPRSSFAALPRVSVNHRRPTLQDPDTRAADPNAPKHAFKIRGLSLWGTDCRLWELKGLGASSLTEFTGAALFTSRAMPVLLNVLAPTLPTDQHVVATTRSGDVALYRVPRSTNKGAAELVSVLANRVADAAAGLFRSFWNRGTSGSSGTAGGPGSSSGGTTGGSGDRPRLEGHTPLTQVSLQGVTLQRAALDPTHRFCAVADPARGRVMLVDLEVGAVVRVLKGCRAPQVAWVQARGAASPVLAVYLGVRGIVEFYSPAAAARLSAVKVFAHALLAGSANSVVLLSPSGDTRRVTAAFVARTKADDGDELGTLHRCTIPPGFAGTAAGLLEAIRTKAAACGDNGADLLRLLLSLPLNFPPHHLIDAIDAMDAAVASRMAASPTEHDDGGVSDAAVTFSADPTSGNSTVAAPTLLQIRHQLALRKAVLTTLTELAALPLPAADGNRITDEESSAEAGATTIASRKSRTMLVDALDTMEANLTARAVAHLRNGLAAPAQTRCFTRIPTERFVGLFQYGGYRPALRPDLTHAERTQLAETLFGVANGHPQGAATPLRQALGIGDAEASSLFIEWLAEKYTVSSWLATPTFLVALHSLKHTPLDVFAAAVRRTSAQEPLLPWLCVVRHHMAYTAGVTVGLRKLRRAIEQAVVIHELSRDPQVPPTVVDIATAEDANIIVAICAPLVARLTPQADERWMADVRAAVDAVAKAIDEPPRELHFAFALSTVRAVMARCDGMGVATATNTRSALALLRLVAPELTETQAAHLAAVVAHASWGWWRTRLRREATTANAAAVVEPSLSEIIDDDAPRREVLDTLGASTDAVQLAVACLSKCIAAASEATAGSSGALVVGRDRAETEQPSDGPEPLFTLASADDRWSAQRLSSLQPIEALLAEASSALAALQTLRVLLREAFPRGDSTRFPWTSLLRAPVVLIDPAAHHAHRDAGDAAKKVMPTVERAPSPPSSAIGFDAEGIRQWITAEVASVALDAGSNGTRGGGGHTPLDFGAFEALHTVLRLEPVDFVSLLELERHLAEGRDDVALAVDLPRVATRAAAAALMLDALRPRLYSALQHASRRKHSGRGTAALLSELPADAREWIVSLPQQQQQQQQTSMEMDTKVSTPSPQPLMPTALTPSSEELAYVVAECEELRAASPWVESLPSVCQRLLQAE